MLFEDYIFDECYTDYDRLSDPNKNAAGEGTKQRITQAIGSEIDESTVPLISDMQKNIFLTKDMLSKFIGHKESEAGYSRRWGTWFSDQTPAFRKNVARIIDRLYRIRCTKLCHEIMFAWLGFGVTITEVFGMEGLDTIHTFDMPLHTLDSFCPRCTTYEVYITGSGGSLTADDIEAITAILKFNQPVDAQIADIFYNGVSVLEDFDQTDPDLSFNPYIPEDADAIAFMDATGIQGTVTKRAIEILVLALKAAGLWNKLLAIYPMVGGTSTTCKYNLKDPRDLDAAYRLTFVNAPTIDGHGVLWNGVNQYADTHLAPGVALSTRNALMAYYNLKNTVTNLGAAYVDIGTYGSNHNRYDLASHFGAGVMGVCVSGPGVVATVARGTDINGLYVVTSDNTTLYPYRNGVPLSTVARAVNATANNSSFWLGAVNRGYPNSPTQSKCGFAAIGNSLTTGEAVIFSGVVNEFCERMGRNTY